MATALIAAPPALAGTAAAAESLAAHTAQGRKSYDIPAGPLEAALNRFGREAGILLSYPTELTAGLQTRGLTGSYSVPEALAALLHGTGLTAVPQSNGGYALLRRAAQAERESTLPTVNVTASAEEPGELPRPYAGGQVARGARLGLLGNKDVMDTPFNITAYTEQAIQDRQARSVADVVVNDPSVRNINPTAGRFDQFTIRGFRIINSDIAFGGLYGMLSTYSVAPETAERIEVLKGPSAMLTGMSPNGGVGGGINLVPKRAHDVPLTQVTATYASEGQFGGHVDIGRRFGPDNRFGVRFNGAYRDGDVAVDDQALELGLGALALDYRGERLRLSLDLGHQERNVDAPLERVSFTTVDILRAPDADKNFSQPWTYANTRDTHIVPRAEYDLTQDITAYAAAGVRRGRYDFLTHAIRVTNARGDFTVAPSYYRRNEDAETGEAGLRMRFETGPVRHALNLSASLFRLEVRDFTISFASSASNLYKPVTRARPNLGDPSEDLPKTSETELSSVAFADTLSILDDRVQLTLDVRDQRVRAESWNATTGRKTADYDESKVTPAAALVVKVRPDVSLYANYIEALTRGPTAPNPGSPPVANPGEVFPPFKSKQVEGGAKLDFGRLSTTLSVFQIRQPSSFTDPVTTVFGVDGEQRNRGIEWNVFGEAADGVRLLGGVTLLDAKLTDTAGGNNDGNRAPGVSRLNAVLGAEWDLGALPGLTLSGRVIHGSSQYADAANTQKIPRWTRYDLGLRYAVKAGRTPLTLRATVENVLDRDYWASATDGLGVVLGAPRTVLVSATVDF